MAKIRIVSHKRFSSTFDQEIDIESSDDLSVKLRKELSKAIRKLNGRSVHPKEFKFMYVKGGITYCSLKDEGIFFTLRSSRILNPVTVNKL